MNNSIQWINCKDKLPEKDGQYLCISKVLGRYFLVEILPFYKKFINDDNIKFKNVFIDGDAEYGDWVDDDVIFWMQIPEIPEELRGKNK